MTAQRLTAGSTTIENENFTDERGTGRIVRTYSSGKLISSVKQYFTEKPRPATALASTIRFGRYIAEQSKRRGAVGISLVNGVDSSDDDGLGIVVGPITPR